MVRITIRSDSGRPSGAKAEKPGPTGFHKIFTTFSRAADNPASGLAQSVSMKSHLLSIALVLAGIGSLPSESPRAITLETRLQQEKIHRSAERCTLQVDLVGIDRVEKRTAPINLAVVLDRSGSMEGEKLEEAREAALVAFDQLAGSDVFSLVVYDQEVDVLIAAQPVWKLEDIRRILRQVESRGSTALHAGVSTGAEQLEEFFDKNHINRVILLSDGIANVGPSSPGELAKLGARLRRSGISVSTVGLGNDYNENLMTALAEAAAGNYYYVEDPEELPGIFASELGEIKGLVARDVILRIELPAEIKEARVLGDDRHQSQNGVLEIPLDDLFAGQTRRFLIDCTLPDEKPERLAVATTQLVYHDARTGERQETSRKAEAETTDDLAAAEKSQDLTVMANRVTVENRIAKEEAMKLLDDGDSEAAQQVLRSRYEVNQTLPAAVAGAARIDEAQDFLSATQRRLAEEGDLSKADKKAIKYRNYQEKYQRE